MTNLLDDGGRSRMRALSNHRADALSAEDGAWVEAKLDAARAHLSRASLADVKRLSAELNGVLTFLEGAGASTETMRAPHHILIATDTYAGEHSGKIVEEWLLGRGHSTHLLVPRDLRTDDLDGFRVALAGLVEILLPLLAEYRKQGYAPVFNLTGGFKGVLNFLQTVACVSGAESVYLFEGTSKLMRIPRLPIRLDVDGIVREHFDLFRRLAVRGPVTEDEVLRARLPETLLFLMDGRATLSEWGNLAWLVEWQKLGGERLWPTRDRRIAFTSRFEKGVEKLPRHRILAVNDALDALVRRLDGDISGMGKAATFKPLGGKPRPPATHELYAWTDEDAGRILLRQGSDGWIAEEIVSHL